MQKMHTEWWLCVSAVTEFNCWSHIGVPPLFKLVLPFSACSLIQFMRCCTKLKQNKTKESEGLAFSLYIVE